MTEPLSVCVGWVCLRGSMGLGFAGKIVPSYPEILTAISSNLLASDLKSTTLELSWGLTE